MWKFDLQTWVRLEMGMIDFFNPKLLPWTFWGHGPCSTFASFTVQMGDVLRYVLPGSAVILETLRPGCTEVSQSTRADTTLHWLTAQECMQRHLDHLLTCLPLFAWLPPPYLWASAYTPVLPRSISQFLLLCVICPYCVCVWECVLSVVSDSLKPHGL